ncbi:MAG: class II aldolase/adducin family protein [Proteobacteria bacterium]|nr:class II aldolase/adducin family protein [Pseudomonadota bacterium]
MIRYQKSAGAAKVVSEPQLRQEMVRVGLSMWQQGLVAGTDGNMSARLSRDLFLCTPSGFSKGRLRPEQLLVVDGQGRPLDRASTRSRGLRPSSEMLMHLEAYRQRPDIGAVVHAHPPTVVALSIAGVSLAQCLLPEVILGFFLIPTTGYATPASDEGVGQISEFIGRYDALVLQRHGSLSVGSTLEDAYLKLEKMEHVARVTQTLVQLGVNSPLPPGEISKLVRWRREQGMMQQGHDEDLCRACGVCRS